MTAHASVLRLEVPDSVPGVQPRSDPASEVIEASELRQILATLGIDDSNAPYSLKQLDEVELVLVTPLQRTDLHPVWTIVGDDAREIALRIFGSRMSGRRIFHSSNPRLTEKVYLPSQLAIDGDGIFFDERVVARLFELGVVPVGGEVLRVQDLGGWDDLQSLDAGVEVVFESGGRRRSRTLVGTAEVPVPPLTISEIEIEYRRRVAQFEGAGVAHSFLAAERGVLYQLRGRPLTQPYSAEMLDGLGVVAARVDALARDRHFSHYEGVIDLGLSGDRLVTQDDPLAVFCNLDESVVWADVRYRIDDLVPSEPVLPGLAYSWVRAAIPTGQRDRFSRSYHTARRLE